MPTNRYLALKKITHSGVDYLPGSPLGLSDAYAAPLLAIGAIAPDAGAVPSMPVVGGDVLKGGIDAATGQEVTGYLKFTTSPDGLFVYAGEQDVTSKIGNGNGAAQSPATAVARTAAAPKLHAISAIADGSSHQGFPSVVRYNGNDYIIYRRGTGHVEPTPIGSTASIVCAVRPVNSNPVSSRTTIASLAGTDYRSVNILRDAFGGAVLVNGMFKVVVFEFTTNYLLSNVKSAVYDLDPNNLTAGLVNRVELPSPCQAVTSDFRQLSDGKFAFVGYSGANKAYWVTTTDFANFQTDLIGDGNEAAWCETYDGYINVVLRNEENGGEKNTPIYKRLVAGGQWKLHATLPYTLNAPVLVQARAYTPPPVTGGTGGWLLFARDKTGRKGLNSDSVPVSDLVCLWSKDDYGRSLNKFTGRTVICGIPRGSVSEDGDAHYASVVAGPKSGALSIYTYGAFRTDFEGADTSYSVGVFRIAATLDQTIGVVTERIKGRNYIKNGNFVQGVVGHDISSANSAIIADPTTGNNILRMVNAVSPTVGMFAEVEKGETIFPKIIMRTLSTNLANGRHLIVNIYDYTTGSAVLISSVIPELPPAIFDGDYHAVVLPPFVAPCKRVIVTLGTSAGITAAESHVAHIILSDDYTPAVPRPEPIGPIIAVANIALTATTTGGQNTAISYSNGIWSAVFGMVKRGSGIPYGASANTDIAISFRNAKSGTLKLIDTGSVVNADGSITGGFAVAPGESGTIGASITAQAVVIIQAAAYPFIGSA